MADIKGKDRLYFTQNSKNYKKMAHVIYQLLGLTKYRPKDNIKSKYYFYIWRTGENSGEKHSKNKQTNKTTKIWILKCEADQFQRHRFQPAGLV